MGLPKADVNDVPEDDLVAFIATSIGSIWALELLLLLRRDPGRSWDAESLVRELRSSPTIISEALGRLQRVGLTAQDRSGTCRYDAASPRLDRLASELEKVYAARPTTVINAIVAARTV